LASAALSDRLLHSVVWFSAAALVVMVLLLLQILQLRMGLIARKRREKRFLRQWQPLLAAAIAGDTVDPPALRWEDTIQFFRLWNHLHESVRGSARKHLNIFALRVDALQYIAPLLYNRQRGKKLLALTTLGNLQARDDWPTILEFCRDADSLLSWTAAHTLFQIDPHMALKDLEEDIVERLDWPAPHLIVLLQEAGSDEIYTTLAARAVQLCEATDPHELARLYRLLQIMHAAPYLRVMPAIHQIIRRTRDDETLAQCLKFLREPEDLDLVRTHVSHLNWVVRLQVAHALGRFGTTEDSSRLVLLLSDPVWWVRYRAAQALMSLTHGNAELLKEARGNLKDPFALDMLTMVAAEKGHP
jgi:HEAT repeat protein